MANLIAGSGPKTFLSQPMILQTEPLVSVCEIAGNENPGESLKLSYEIVEGV